jgi:transposase InsO family protein
MKRMGVEALYRRPNTSKPAAGHKIYPYLFRDLPVTRPNQVWAMDITYIPMARGFVYLAAVIDWYSRRVLAWRLSITMEVEFCLAAVEEALVKHGVNRLESRPLVSVRIRHPQHGRQGERAGGGGEQEVLAFGPAGHGDLQAATSRGIVGEITKHIRSGRPTAL